MYWLQFSLPSPQIINEVLESCKETIPEQMYSIEVEKYRLKNSSFHWNKRYNWLYRIQFKVKNFVRILQLINNFGFYIWSPSPFCWTRSEMSLSKPHPLHLGYCLKGLEGEGLVAHKPRRTVSWMLNRITCTPRLT